MSAFPSDDNEKLLPGTVSDFLSHRRMTRCDWRVALAAVLSQCWHRLSEHRARTADDRRADGLVHFRVSWNGRTATHQCASFLAFKVGAIFTLDLLAGGFHVSGANRLGDSCFVVCLVAFALALAKRFRQRKDSPPPNFVLVGLGFVSAMAGTVLIAAAESAQYSRAYQFGSALLNQSWVLLQVLGVAPFFIRRLLDLPAPHLPESRTLPPQWEREAAVAALFGLVIMVSFWIEVIGLPRTGGWIRAGAIGFYVLIQIPFRGRTFLANSLRGGVMSIFFGFVGVALLPLYRIGVLHIVFITGFNLVAFTVAIRDRKSTRLNSSH